MNKKCRGLKKPNLRVRLAEILEAVCTLNIDACCLPAEVRYVGPREEWYDGPIYSVGFWWFHFYCMPGR